MHGHIERHAIERIGWLRAAVLGANDGIISTASLMVGVASASTSTSEVLVAGFASLAAGAMAMAAGEFVSVSSQADTEAADLTRERRELETQSERELIELAKIYEARGVSKELALEVAKKLMAHDALAAHARDELGINDTSTAQPVQAALTSALTFSAGAIVPVLTALLAPPDAMQVAIPIVSLLFLAGLGAVSAKVGGAGIVKPTIRVAFWGALAMVTTGLVGALIGKAI
ncbi:VIT family protein [Rhizobium sp. 2MFCol3.1]|uniref:VIT1/CCC1 transporter family protein n=1 Tax=Rhizobium sp. 2MFCol3.1 TaxID=1246459 RepID=UPI000372F0B4|nr:VIT family protein [Rhizobium sp. 2MFCol3.1]